MALPWELQVQTPKLGCVQRHRVVRLARGRHTELPAFEPGAVPARNNSNKSQRLPPVLELRGCIHAALLSRQLRSPLRLQPCLLAAGPSKGHAPSAAPRCCPPILSRQLPPAPTLPESWLRTASRSPAPSLQRRLCHRLGGRKTPFCNSHTLHNRP